MKIKTENYWACIRCKANSLEPTQKMIPCPRGGCEARINGKITTELRLFDKNEFEVANNEEITPYTFKTKN